MSKKPTITGATRKDRLGVIASSRDESISTKRDVAEATRALDQGADGAIPEDAGSHTGVAKRPAPPTLPKLTLYAHRDVIRSIRQVAVNEDVQVQEILRRAVRDYLAKHGHLFEDLAAGK